MKNNTLAIYLPTYLNYQVLNLQASNNNASAIKLSQGTADKPFTLQFNSTLGVYFISYILDQLSLNSTFTLTLNNISNPSTNQPFYFIV